MQAQWSMLQARGKSKHLGACKSMPVTSALFLIGSVSIAAMPPTNGFAGELLLYQAFFQSFAVTDPLLNIFLIIALSALPLPEPAAALFVKLRDPALQSRALRRAGLQKKSRNQCLGPAVPAAFCILGGLFSKQLLSLAGWKIDFPDLLLLGILLGLIYTALFVIIRSRNGPCKVSETWGCGIPALAPYMEYSSAGFSEPLVMIFKSIYRTKIVNRPEF